MDEWDKFTDNKKSRPLSHDDNKKYLKDVWVIYTSNLIKKTIK